MKKIIMLLILAAFFSGCIMQTRAFARLTGSALELKLPQDFSKPISFASGRKGEKDLFYWTSILLQISKRGLENRDIIGKNNYNETHYLNHLDKIIDNKLTNADHMIAKFSKNGNLNDLYDK